MKIAIISCVWPPYGAGVGVVAKNQAEYLTKLGHKITVFTPAYHNELARVEINGGLEIRFLRPLLSFGNAAVLPQLLSQIRNFDLVHLHLYFIGSTWFVKTICHLFDIPLVVQYHNDLIGSGVRRIIFRFYTKCFLTSLVKNAKFIFGLSEAHVAGSDLANLSDRVKNKIRYLPNGVNTELFCPGEMFNNLRQKFNIFDHKILLFVGGLDQAHYFKGLPVLLSALSILSKKDNDIFLIVVGEGELKKDYQVQAQVLGVAKNIIWAGGIDQQKLPDYYRLADLFILPSVAVEAFPVVVLEAMACAKPVITTTLPGPAALVGQDGLVVPINDSVSLSQAIVRLFEHPDERKFLGESARIKVVTNYSWPRVTQKLVEYYKEALL